MNMKNENLMEIGTSNSKLKSQYSQSARNQAKIETASTVHVHWLRLACEKSFQ